jgi:hypothetical protein
MLMPSTSLRRLVVVPLMLIEPPEDVMPLLSDRLWLPSIVMVKVPERGVPGLESKSAGDRIVPFVSIACRMCRV